MEFLGVTTRESHIYPRPVFWFVPGIFGPGTNNYICTGWRHQPIQMPSHRIASAPSPTHPVQMWAHLSRFLLWPGTGVQRLFFLLLPPSRAPPHSSSSNSSPPPQWRPREFLPDLRWLIYDLTHWSNVEVSYFILPSYTFAILSNILCT
jgi:hypothetical protein